MRPLLLIILLLALYRAATVYGHGDASFVSSSRYSQCCGVNDCVPVALELQSGVYSFRNPFREEEIVSVPDLNVPRDAGNPHNVAFACFNLSTKEFRRIWNGLPCLFPAFSGT